MEEESTPAVCGLMHQNPFPCSFEQPLLLACHHQIQKILLNTRVRLLIAESDPPALLPNQGINLYGDHAMLSLNRSHELYIEAQDQDLPLQS